MGKGRRRWGAGVGADATLGGVGASEGGGPVRGGGGLEPAFVVVVGAAGGDPRVWCVGINEAYRQFLAGLGVRTPMVGPRPEAPVRPEFVVEALAGAERVATSGVSLRYGVGLEGGDGRVDFEVTLEPLLDGDGGLVARCRARGGDGSGSAGPGRGRQAGCGRAAVRGAGRAFVGCDRGPRR